MSTASHQQDVVNLAAVLLGAGAADGSLIYRPGELLFDILQVDHQANAITVEVQAQTSNLPGALAVLAVVQLAIDAAAAAVEFRSVTVDEGAWADDPQYIEARLRDLVPSLDWDLEIVQLRDGSIKGIFRKLAQSDSGRKKILAVAALAAAVMPLIVPAWATGAGVVAAVLVLGDALFPVRPTQALAQLAQSQGVSDERAAQLPSAEQKSAQSIAAVPLHSVDPSAATGAQVEKVAIKVESLPGYYMG